jgi:chromosome segregation protein
MRLTKIKLAGFKSFVDPTQVTFPSNLTGVVGPNGCGKSNIIDAVRWVMGELSAKHLRGDNMADVVFNGSSARKPVGMASVELVFDNADGKIGGAYASYTEVSLRRQVSRDGSSGYFINGARCRRKDITNLFLGTGLGSRSYAIIEQGMISRVIEARTDDMRAFVEEAAGISRYKERRKETESRVAATRENLERLQDLRDEVDKHIRHLTRQAGMARRYQAFKESERLLAGQLLALRLLELDSGAVVHDSAMRARELAMQAALAEQRSAESQIEQQHASHTAAAERLTAVQGRHYAAGNEITRLTQAIQHSRELHARRRTDLAQVRSRRAEVEIHLQRDQEQLAGLAQELSQLAPDLAAAQQAESEAGAVLAAAEQAQADWQQRWERFHRAEGAADQTTQVERARIEQLDSQLGQQQARLERIRQDRESLVSQELSDRLAQLTEREALTHEAAEEASRQGTLAAERVQSLRSRREDAEKRLEAARRERERARAELVSLEAEQRAALSAGAGDTAKWLGSSALASRPRIAQSLEVEPAWAHAVETALGEQLQAVTVERLEEHAASLAGLSRGRITLIESAEGGPEEQTAGAGDTLAARVRRGSRTVLAQLARVLTAESLTEALARRASLGPDESIITRTGEWLGRRWLRVSRGLDPHAGVLEREQRLKERSHGMRAAEEQVTGLEALLAGVRDSLEAAEGAREEAQAQLHSAHRTHTTVAGELAALRGRVQESLARRARLDEEAAEVGSSRERTLEALERARAELDRGIAALTELDEQRPQLESERDSRSQAVTGARRDAQETQRSARDLTIRHEARRTTQEQVAVNLARMSEQRAQLASRATELELELAGGDEPIVQLEQTLQAVLEQRLSIEQELIEARAALEEAERVRVGLVEQRGRAESAVTEAREAMESARLAVQETRVRREALAEQLGQMQMDFAQLQQGLPAEASVPVWEDNLAQVRADIEKLGSVNLAAIEELKGESERKEYLDRQFADLTAALETLAEAMHKIDQETRTRFEDTFGRINKGLQDKFPRLFGGGSASLELVGDDILSAGVAVMARPPGKKNSSIHQLSGGEKALTAVALVFSIFDLNPAPFCLLDEVDAPLDEHNVGRFCEIVREMSGTVQFVFITHNKTTMQLAQQLIGVTQNEPGVSRLVSVDVDEAVRLAQVPAAAPARGGT